ncbi:MAG: hypothetical protein JOY96_02325, partial [Verrucomicrobia bacterium]|nr:hypothetical protein [Verrucomicrobiota bacterium]
MPFLNSMRPIFLSLLVYAFASTSGFSDVLTYHNDAQRTGLNSNEINLTPANVNPATFGLLRNLSVDGQVYAQPLYVSSVSILVGTTFKGRHNLIIVCTENSTVYAFDADTGALWWKTSMLGTNETPGYAWDCGDIAPNIGVTATPVIDRSQGPFGRIFVLAQSMSGDQTTYYERVHALDLSTGRDVLTAVTVQAIYPGNGADSNGQGYVVWKPLQRPTSTSASYGERGRAALLLSGGNIYTAWGSYCDHTPYSGWVICYNEATLKQTGVFNSNPNGYPISQDTYQSGDGLWGSGCPLAASTAGDIFAETGNGPFDTNLVNGFPQTSDYGDSLLKLEQSNGAITVADYFTPYNEAYLDGNNLDFGSGGVMVLPPMTDSKGVVRNLIISGDKNA